MILFKDFIAFYSDCIYLKIHLKNKMAITFKFMYYAKHARKIYKIYLDLNSISKNFKIVTLCALSTTTFSLYHNYT